MACKAQEASEPDWLNPANDRKTPYTDAELDRLASDFLAMNKDVADFAVEVGVADRRDRAPETVVVLGFEHRDQRVLHRSSSYRTTGAPAALGGVSSGRSSHVSILPFETQKNAAFGTSRC